MVARVDWVVALVGAGALMGLAACGGPVLTPLQSEYQHEEERALRYYARGELPRALRSFAPNFLTKRSTRPILTASVRNSAAKS